MRSLIDTGRGDRGQISTYELDRYSKLLKQNVDRSIAFFRQYAHAVKYGNPISNIVLQLASILADVPPSDSFSTFMRAKNSEDKICIPNRITTDSFKADVSQGHFYGEIPVVLVSWPQSTGSSASVMANRWQDLQPVKVLVSPTAKVMYVRPDLITANKGYAIIGIDIPMLAVMFGAWANINNKKPITDRENSNAFVARYVLPNMMFSAANASIANMVGLDEEEFNVDNPKVVKQPTALIDYNDGFYRRLQDAILEVNASEVTLTKMAQHIPMFYGGEDMTRYLDMFPGTVSMNNRWVKLAYECPLIYGLAKVTTNDTSTTETYNYFKVLNRQIVTNRVVSQVPVDSGFRDDVDFYLSEISRFLESRA